MYVTVYFYVLNKFIIGVGKIGIGIFNIFLDVKVKGSVLFWVKINQNPT